MAVLKGLLGLLLIYIALVDAFETIILPRRIRRSLRLTALFYRLVRVPWHGLAKRISDRTRRENMLSYFGPLSLLVLIVVWAAMMITGYALLYNALGIQYHSSSPLDFGTDLYASSTTFFPLGLGVLVPQTFLAHVVTVMEVANGFGFLALILSYLPSINTAFSKREVNVSMLDERAGSPPTALEFLKRHSGKLGASSINQFLCDWEGWSAELLESHLSYPVLAYFRSQHENQSWLAALTMVLDLSTLVLVGIDDLPAESARLTFAMARHTAVDLSQVFNSPPSMPAEDRLPPGDLAQLREALAQLGLPMQSGVEADRLLHDLRKMYEPYLNALAQRLLFDLPPWIAQGNRPDNWQTSAWEQ